ncbi:hypothetical protein ACLBYG_20965 [Methylobacterium sp. D53M]
MSSFACKALRADRDRVEVWSRVPGCEISVLDGIYRFERAPARGDRRQPSPAPIPEALARAAIAAGVPLRRPGDLFGGVL